MLGPMPTDDEIIDAANRFFRSIGGAVKKGATTAVKAGQSVVGVGRGEVRVGLDALRFRAGGDVGGKVTVALTEPIDARRLEVELRASQRGVETRGGEDPAVVVEAGLRALGVDRAAARLQHGTSAVVACRQRQVAGRETGRLDGDPDRHPRARGHVGAT